MEPRPARPGGFSGWVCRLGNSGLVHAGWVPDGPVNTMAVGTDGTTYLSGWRFTVHVVMSHINRGKDTP